MIFVHVSIMGIIKYGLNYLSGWNQMKTNQSLKENHINIDIAIIVISLFDKW